MWLMPFWMAPTVSCFLARLLLETSQSRQVSCWHKNPMACLQAFPVSLQPPYAPQALLAGVAVKEQSTTLVTADASITECGMLHWLEMGFLVLQQCRFHTVVAYIAGCASDDQDLCRE